MTTVFLALVAGCSRPTETGEATKELSQSFVPSPFVHTTAIPPMVTPTLSPTPTTSFLGEVYDPSLDLWDPPVEVPFKLEIPALKVNAPVIAVGLTAKNEMDAPRGPINDPIWHTAFWYRASGVPGEPGTATFAGHVNDPLGTPEIFARLKDLDPGDLILINSADGSRTIEYRVDLVKTYTIQEVNDPAVLARIYGHIFDNGTATPQLPDGLSHITLITCAGNLIRGQYDHYTVVYATLAD